MAMAHKAPADGYRSEYYVSKHALARLRERDPQADAKQHRTDEDLTKLIDWAVVDAVRANKVTAILDDGHRALLADCRDSSVGLYALLKSNHRGATARSGLGLAVVTLYGDAEVDHAVSTGRWTRRDGTPLLRAPGEAATSTLVEAPPPPPPSVPGPASAPQSVRASHWRSDDPREGGPSRVVLCRPIVNARGRAVPTVAVAAVDAEDYVVRVADDVVLVDGALWPTSWRWTTLPGAND